MTHSRTDTPQRPSRAGRNLPLAIGVGVGIGAIALALLYWFRPGFVALIGIIVVLAVWELYGTLRSARHIHLLWLPVGAGAVGSVVGAWWWGHTAQIVGIVLGLLGVMFLRLVRGAAGYLTDVGASSFVLLYLGGLGSFATLLAVGDDGWGRTLVFLLAVVCSDTGGYAVGVLFGKHPMAPTISPKKSWEGLAGSVLFAVASGVIAMPLLLAGTSWWQGAIFGAAISVVAVCGDLAESLIKRDLGVKDMGHSVPGHGGVMDRLDSLLPSAAVAYLLLVAFA